MKRLLKALTEPRTHAYDSTLISLGSKELIAYWLWCPNLSKEVATGLVERMGLDHIRIHGNELQCHYGKFSGWITVSTFRDEP